MKRNSTMLGKYVFISALFLPVFCLGQKNKTKEFMEDAVHAFRLRSDTFNLVDLSTKAKFDSNSVSYIKWERKDFFQKNPDFNPDEFIEKSKRSQVINWGDYHIKDAHIYSIDSARKLPRFIDVAIHKYVDYKTPKKFIDSADIAFARNCGNALYVPVKRHWKKKRIEKQLREFAKRYRFSNDNINFCFICSTPIFSDDDRYAFITADIIGAGLIPSYLFKKVNNHWTLLLTM